MSSAAGAADHGLQAERTLLAWRRTALAVAVVSAVGIRLAGPALGWPAVVLGTLGVGLGLLSYLATNLGYRRVRQDLRRSHRHPGNGWAQAGLTVAVLVMGLMAIAYLALR